MEPRAFLLVDGADARRRGAPRGAVDLGRAEAWVARRAGAAALAVWLPSSARLDRRIRALVKAAGGACVSAGGPAGVAAHARSRSLGFAAHLASPLGAVEARRTLRRLNRGARAGTGPGSGARAAARLRILSDVSRAVNSVLEPRRAMEIVMGKAQELIRSEAWSLLLVDEKDQSLTFQISKGERAPKGDHRLSLGEGIAGWVARYRKPAIVNDAARDRRFDPRFDTRTGFRTRSILCAPLISRGRIIGVVELINKRRGPFTREDLETLMLLVEPGAIAIENALLYKRSTELSFTDDLTQLFNARYLRLSLGRELKRAKRYGQPVSLIFLDLDGFKTVNDSHGHLAGSRALVEVGQEIQRTVREIDTVSRYGGDEFTIVLPQTGPEGAMVIAERLRQGLEERTFLAGMGHEVRLTASFGVACFPAHAQTRDELIQKADRAMYQIKEKAKNGVALAT